MDKVIGILKKSNLLKSGFWYTFANFFLKGVNFISIPIFVRMMSVKDYGITNNFTAWTLIATYIVGLNLNTAINNANFEFKSDMKRFMSSVLSLSVFVFIIIMVSTVIIQLFFKVNIEFSDNVMLCVIIQSFSMFAVSFISSYYMINGLYIKNILVTFLSTLCNFGFSFIFMLTIYKYNPALGRIYGSTFGLAILAIFIVSKILFEGQTLYDPKYWKYSLKLSVPVIPHSLGNILLAQFDRIMISNSIGNEAAGIYSYSYNISVVLNVMWLSMNSAWIPWFYKKLELGKIKKIKEVMGMYSLFFSLISIIAINILIDIGYIMGSSSYRVGLKLIIPISLGYFFIFLYGFAVNSEFFYKETIFIGVITSISAGINVILNVYYIPKYGYMAGAFTTLVTFIFQFFCHSYRARQIEIREKKYFINYKVIAESLFLVSLYAFLLYYFFDLIIVRYLLMILFSFIVGLMLIRNVRRQYES